MCFSVLFGPEGQIRFTWIKKFIIARIDYEVDLYIITKAVKEIFGVIYNSNHHLHSNRDNRDLIVLPGMVVFIHPKHHLLLHDEEDDEEEEEEEGVLRINKMEKKENLVENQMRLLVELGWKIQEPGRTAGWWSSSRGWSGWSPRSASFSPR